jgi:ComF family protein
MNRPAAAGRILLKVGRTLLDAILPPLCLGCREIVVEPGALCADCWRNLSFVSPPQCARCGVPFAQDIGERTLCIDCLVRPPGYRRARAAMVYDARSRRLVLPFKHADRTDMAPACGAWMARAGAELVAQADLVAPVPLHWRRLLTRRYNQAVLLARAVARDAGLSLAPDLLRRMNWTASQAGLRAKERRRNVRGAFDVNPRWMNRLRDRTVLLVDDVLTTGATVDACVAVLLREGAAHVDVLTLARVVRPALQGGTGTSRPDGAILPPRS